MSTRPAGVHTATHHPSVNEAGNSASYEIRNDSTTVSKSVQSKIKNLAYMLSAPFRALMRQIVQSRVSDRASTGGLTNIKSPAPSASPRMEEISQSGVVYEVVGERRGVGKFKPPPPDFDWA